MRHTYHINAHMVFWSLLGIVCVASVPSNAAEPAWWTQQKRDCGLPSNLAYNNWDGRCNSAGSTSAPSANAEAARRAQEEAAAEAERIERERLAEEKRQKDAAFIRDRDAAANTLKGSTGTNTSSLKGLSDSDNHGLKGSGTDAGAQLKSVERHGRETPSQDIESARKTAQKGFDTGGKPSGNLVYPDKKKQQIPPSALDRQVPAAAQKDPEVQQSLAWYRKLDNLKAENSQKIAAIKEQQKKGTGDAAVLAAQLGTLTNQSKQIDNDQAKVTETVKKRVTNLGFKLVESPESTTPQAIKK